MENREIINAVKIGAFDAIVKASKARDSYFKRADVIFDIILEAGRMIERVEGNENE